MKKFLHTAGRLNVVERKEYVVNEVVVVEEDLNLNLLAFYDLIKGQLREYNKEEVVCFRVTTDLTIDEIDLICDTVPSIIANTYTTTTHKNEIVYLPRDTIRHNIYLPLLTLNTVLNKIPLLSAFTIEIMGKDGTLLWRMVNEEVQATI